LPQGPHRSLHWLYLPAYTWCVCVTSHSTGGLGGALFNTLGPITRLSGRFRMLRPAVLDFHFSALLYPPPLSLYSDTCPSVSQLASFDHQLIFIQIVPIHLPERINTRYLRPEVSRTPRRLSSAHQPRAINNLCSRFCSMRRASRQKFWIFDSELQCTAAW